jgi:hypothetical protein
VTPALQSVTDKGLAIVPGSSGIETIFSRKERALFIRKSSRVMFITEFIVLVEYVEVVLPIVYSTFTAGLYNFVRI